MHKIKNFILTILLFFCSAITFCSEQQDDWLTQLQDFAVSQFAEKADAENQEHEILNPMNGRFKEEIVDDQTHFNYQHLEDGCNLAGLDFQDLMRKKLMGKDLQSLVENSSGEYVPALYDALDHVERIIFSCHKKQLQNVFLDAIDKDLTDDQLESPALDYIKYYKHVLSLDPLVFSWPMFVDGFKLVDRDFKVFMQEQMGDKPMSEFMFTEKNDEVVVINPEFKSAVAAAQVVMMDGMMKDVSNALFMAMIPNLDELKNKKFIYLMKHKNVSFVKKTLKLIWEDYIDSDLTFIFRPGSDFQFRKIPRVANLIKSKSDDGDLSIIKLFIHISNFDICKDDPIWHHSKSIMLHISAYLKDKDVLDLLIKNNVDIDNQLTDCGKQYYLTPLLFSMFNEEKLKKIPMPKFYECAEKLLDAGADITLPINSEGHTMIDFLEKNCFNNDDAHEFLISAMKRRALQYFSKSELNQKQEDNLQKSFDLLKLDYQAFKREHVQRQDELPSKKR